MPVYPRTVLKTAAVKDLRERLLSGGSLTMREILDLIGSHEQLRAVMLTRSERLRQTDIERDRLQQLVEELARKGRG